jgi:desulfoferrodoxin (superoxide reductase-like protein)
MNHRELCPWLQELTRREFLSVAAGLAAMGLCGAGRGEPIGPAAENLGQPPEARPSTAFEQLHLPTLQMPRFTANGAHVPLVVDLAHPMDSEHYITCLHLLNETDPVPSKGIFRFTPANGRAHLAVQARMHSGDSVVLAIAECNRHGRWAARQPITIPDGGGGCADPVAPAGRPVDAEIRPPALRIPELIARGQLRRGELMRVQVKVRHPNRTGLAFHDGRFTREAEPFYLETMDVFYGGRCVSRYEMSPGLSDNPFITFMLRATEEAPIRVVLRNNRGEQFEASHGVLLAS